MDISQYNNAMTIEQNKVSNAVNHEVYLRDDQRELKKMMSKGELERRQNQLVLEQGLDNAQEFEFDLA